MNAIVLPLFFLSTALFPPGSLSGPLAAAAWLNPFTHVINALRALILGENIRGGEIAGIVGLLFALSSISFALALWRLRRETAQ